MQMNRRVWPSALHKSFIGAHLGLIPELANICTVYKVLSPSILWLIQCFRKFYPTNMKEILYTSHWKSAIRYTKLLRIFVMSSLLPLYIFYFEYSCRISTSNSTAFQWYIWLSFYGQQRLLTTWTLVLFVNLWIQWIFKYICTACSWVL